MLRQTSVLHGVDWCWSEIRVAPFWESIKLGLHAVFAAEHEKFRLPAEELRRKQAAEAHDLLQRNANFPNEGAEFPSDLGIGSERTEVVKHHERPPFGRLVAHGVFLGVVRATEKRKPAFSGVAALKLVLAKCIQQVELHGYRDGFSGSFHAVPGVAFERLRVVGQASTVVARRQTEAIFDPGFQDSAGVSVAVRTPAVEELHVAAAQTGAGGGLVLGPFVQTKFYGEIIVEDLTPSCRIVDGVKFCK